MRKIAFYTLGCKVNQADTAAMEQLFVQAGYQLVAFEEAADIYVVNTCVVTNMGQSKSRKLIHRAVRQAPQALVVVTGCYPQTSPEEVEAIEGVDLLVGNQHRAQIVELVERALSQKDQQIVNEVQAWQPRNEFEELQGGNEEGKTRAYLKIQEGCNQYCTYCIIPFARGTLRSRSLESIRSEVERLCQAGYQEVVLIGIHLGCYGKENPQGPGLAQAVEAALSVPALQRLRLGSLESVEVSAELLELFKRDRRLQGHLHLPLQAGCDKVLQAMHRPYTQAKYLELLERIRAQVPEVAITTDVIVGFPGETEEDFQATCSFVQQCGFAKIHIFPYSVRKGTPAASFPEQVPESVKQERAARLGVLDKQLQERYQQGKVGQVATVLLEQKRGDYWEGLTGDYVRVYVSSTEQELEGRLATVELTKLYQDGLYGSIIELVK